MKLYLMRHGIANDVSTDPEQGLSDAGREAVQHLADRLKDKQVCFKQVLHSPKTRARQTAQIMRTTLCPTATIITHEHIQPNDSIEILLRDMADWSDDTLVVSHLPFLPNLLGKLVGPSVIDVAFHPATMACLTGSIKQGWQLERVELA